MIGVEWQEVLVLVVEFISRCCVHADVSREVGVKRCRVDGA